MQSLQLLGVVLLHIVVIRLLLSLVVLLVRFTCLLPRCIGLEFNSVGGGVPCDLLIRFGRGCTQHFTLASVETSLLDPCWAGWLAGLGLEIAFMGQQAGRPARDG